MGRMKNMEYYERRLFGPVLQLVHESAAWQPAADIFLTEDKVYVVVEASGVDPRDMDVTYESGVLTVRGYRKHPAESKSPRSFIRMEIPHGHFERALEIPVRCDPETVCASYRDGLITIEAKIVKGDLAREIPIR
jgi:HSP20 family protein